MKCEDNSGVLWFVAGTAIGATLALLFAPQSGKDTRRYIGHKAREGRQQLAERGREFAERGREALDRGREIADEAAEAFEDGRKIFES